MKWAWDGYVHYAWGADHLLPVSKKSDEWFGLGLTLIDSLDTLLLMGLMEEFDHAENWVLNHLSFDKDVKVNLFETTIRVLGGLLSTYWLTGTELYLDRAVDLADRLLVAFDTQSGIPLSDVNLRTRKASGPSWSSDSSSSEVTTLQLEFNYLSRVTGNPKYAEATDEVMNQVVRALPADGLIPQWINPKSGQFKGDTFTLGARGDSYYEYLLKQWIQDPNASSKDYLKDLYTDAMQSVMDQLVQTTRGPRQLTFVGERVGRNFSPKMDHLVCFLSGTLALGAANGLGGGMSGDHMDLAVALADTCYAMYNTTKTGLAPEISMFDTQSSTRDIWSKPADRHNLLRPETVESLFYLYRLTGDRQYQDWGWEIFQAFETYSRVSSGGYTSLNDVEKIPPPSRDKMESFFLGETLKYFWLLFDGVSELTDRIDLGSCVFNTEAHPMPIF
jgi:mannosyl-oligosaccharide alpha-1,2-mannosidase